MPGNLFYICPDWIARRDADKYHIHPDGAKNYCRRVGCAHQASLISSVEGGQSPPDINHTEIDHSDLQRGHSNLVLSLQLQRKMNLFSAIIANTGLISKPEAAQCRLTLIK